jgi:hypothetical protein
MAAIEFRRQGRADAQRAEPANCRDCDGKVKSAFTGRERQSLPLLGLYQPRLGRRKVANRCRSTRGNGLIEEKRWNYAQAQRWLACSMG